MLVLRYKTAAFEMTFALPEIEKAGCQSFTACGRVVTRDKSLRKFFSQKQPLIAAVKHGRFRRFVRLCFNEGGHLHFDIATPAFFRGPWKPKLTRTWTQIQVSLSPFVGQKIDLRGVGVFLLPLDRLPESSLLRTLSVESKTPRASMKLTGGTLSVTGAPIQRITWSLESEGKRVEVRLRSTVEVTVSGTYLVELFELLKESLQIFVLSDEKNSDQP
ncbi:MAG: hypothetical protein HY735_11660 [Verrucomicrobia bacterium]|nr:hypothetical protein [Verrucomicrobiota bacterium]